MSVCFVTKKMFAVAGHVTADMAGKTLSCAEIACVQRLFA